MSLKINWPSHLSQFVGPASTQIETSDESLTPSNFIRVIDSDIGRRVGFNRIAVHHIVLPAGCRTSSPHAKLITL